MKHPVINKIGLTTNGWTLLRINNPRPLDGFIIDGFTSHSYVQTIGSETFTMGVYFLYEKEVYRAWMKKDAHTCSFHAVIKNNNLSEVEEGCVPYTLTDHHNGKGVLSVAHKASTIEYAVEIRALPTN